MNLQRHIRKTYAEMSSKYDSERETDYFKIIEEIELNTLLRHISSIGKSVTLDLGTGTGRFLRYLKGLPGMRVGVDLTMAMLKKSQKADREGLLINCNIEHLPFRDDTFDCVYSFKVFPHIPDIRTVLEEVKRVLKSGGLAILEFYNPISLRRLFFHSKYFTRWTGRKYAVRMVREAGFKVREIIGARTWIPFGFVCHLTPLFLLFRWLELHTCHSVFKKFSGYQIYVLELE
jgi:ubiquinone/menaquinone biosynthesis C-methylase UbiE